MSKGPIDPSSLSRRVLLPEVFHVARVFWYTAYGGIIDKLGWSWLEGGALLFIL